MIQQPGGHYMIVQGINNVNSLTGSGRIQGRQAGLNKMGQRLNILNPQTLANYQPNNVSPIQ